MKDRLADADLVFADPDNGLEPSGFSYGSSMVGKSVLFSELRELVEPGRCLVVYHLIKDRLSTPVGPLPDRSIEMNYCPSRRCCGTA
jgi:hypothetical protein